MACPKPPWASPESLQIVQALEVPNHHICMAAYNMYMVYVANHQTTFKSLTHSFRKVTMFFDLSQDLMFRDFPPEWKRKK